LAKFQNDTVRPSDRLAFIKRPSRDTRSAVRSAEYMENALRLIHDRVHRVHKRSLNATDLLSEEDLKTVERLTGCAARVHPPSCLTTPLVNEYRTITSVCNNNASNTPFARWLPSEYDDGIFTPKGWDPSKRYNGFPLPLVREVSNKILRTRNQDVESDTIYTHFLTIFGQWTDHDLTITPFSPSIRSFSNGIDCDKSCQQASPCFPIRIPLGDNRIRNTSNCIPFFRSAPACGTGDNGYMFGGPNVREQINALTAFIDVGQVYGPEENLALSLRNLTNDLGLLAINQNFSDNGREFLPFSQKTVNMCATRRKATNNNALTEVPCFVAGDERVDENIGLASTHTLFMREHNRLARGLRSLNPHWSGEKIYQEARKIMGGYHQVMTFRDYLPRIVGPDAMTRLLPSYRGYNENMDPSIANVFSTAAFRFAHLAIQPFMFRLDNNYKEHPRFPSVLLHNAFFTPWRLLFEGGIDPLIRGLIGRPAKLNTQQHMMHDELRERLFELTSRLALDLGSLNMQRGRDHGLPGYNAWRGFCGLSQPKNVQQLGSVLRNPDLARRLIQLYGTPDNIDVWLGGVAEPFVRGGRVGELFACIIATQFQKIRNGDRFWWERKEVFTSNQQAALRRVRLARIICDNTGITDVPSDPFLYSPRGQSYTRCSSIPTFDLNPWKEAMISNEILVCSCDLCQQLETSFINSTDPFLFSTQILPDPAHPLDTKPTLDSMDPRVQRDPEEILDHWVSNLFSQSHRLHCSPQWAPGLQEAKGPRGERGPPGLATNLPKSAFSTRLGYSNPPPDRPIVFRETIYNGQNHYDNQTGVFTCVLPGVYEFNFSCRLYRNLGNIELKKNGVNVGHSISSYSGGYISATGSSMVPLEQGDQVWLQSSSGGNTLTAESFFSGHLIFSV
ncbi:PERE peroxidase, partial [Amia calva]|nr:PERE peroxidase [Amia calva]